MGIRIVKSELEVKLINTDGSMPEAKGKLERKSYGSNERLKISVRNLLCPDGTTVSVLADGSEISSFQIMNGKGKTDIESKDGFSIPQLILGQKIEVSIIGQVVLSGVLVKD